MTVYQFSWNEEKLIEFIHNEWKKNLPNVGFILLDNSSRDGTPKKALELEYSGIYHYITGENFSDEEHMKISNNLPFTPKGIVACVDMDEVLQIIQEQLEEELSLGTTIFRFEGWNVFNKHANGQIIGTRMPRYDKFVMFNHDKVKMNFGAGRHECYPKGEVKYSKKVYKLFHYGMWDEEYYINRRKLYNERWSEKNLQMGWGEESQRSEPELRAYYKSLRDKAIIIK